MTEIIASSFLLGAAASYPLLRWARTKNVDLMKIEYHCTTKLLPLLPFGLAAIMAAIYSPAYTIVMGHRRFLHCNGSREIAKQ